jgi:hypothetical protein
MPDDSSRELKAPLGEDRRATTHQFLSAIGVALRAKHPFPGLWSFTKPRSLRIPMILAMGVLESITFSCAERAGFSAPLLAAGVSSASILQCGGMRIVPAFDFRSCYPDDAVTGNGSANPGLPPTGSYESCRDPARLATAKMYVRRAEAEAGGARYEAAVFALYFPKDEAFLSAFSHRHDWESVIVYARDGTPTHMGFSQHGRLTIHPWRVLAIDSLGRPHVRVGRVAVETSAMHPARSPHSAGHTPTPSEWPFPPVVARVLEETDWGDAVCPVTDRNFLRFLGKATPKGYPKGIRWQSVPAPNPPHEGSRDGIFVHRDP